MSKKRNVMEFNNGEAVVEEPVTDEPNNNEESQEGDSALSFEDAGCRASGDTVLTFPSLPNKEFLDYRAGVVINCFDHHPSVMEPVTVSK